MINWILTFSLAVLLYVAYIMDRRCLLSPSFIVTAVMMLSSIVVSINTDYWEYEISVSTYLLIVGSVTAFMMGQYLGQRSKIRTMKKNSNVGLHQHTFFVPSSVVYVGVILFGMVTLFLYYRQQSSNAAMVGMSGTMAGIVQANRYHVDNGADSALIKLLLTGYQVMTYAFLFVFLYNWIVRHTRNRGLLTAGITVIYFGCCALSTNRADIITCASFLAFLVMYLNYYKNGWTSPKKINRKLVVSVLVIAVVMVLLFRYFGTFSGKSGRYTLYDNICIYVGSSIVCLDKYLRGTSNLSSDFQVTLMSSLWSMLNKFGANIPISDSVWNHQYWNNGSSNVYTSLFPLYVKFGALGTLILQFLFGFCSGSLWKRLKKGVVTWSLVVIFASFFYFYTYYSIAERVFSQLFTLTSAIQIVATCVLFSWMERKRNV